MKIDIQIDGINHTIDSRNPDLLAQWILEIFGRVDWNASTWCRVNCWPSYLPYRGPDRPALDWIADTRYAQTLEPRTPRQLLDDMSAALERYERREQP